MISHVFVGTNDFEAALSFYSRVLPTLGWQPRFVERGRPWAGWQPTDGDRPLFLVGKPHDRGEAAPGNGTMIALLAPCRSAVDEFHAASIAAGGSDEGAPGLRPEYHPHYYGVYVRDPDGNKLCACCHTPG